MTHLATALDAYLLLIHVVICSVIVLLCYLAVICIKFGIRPGKLAERFMRDTGLGIAEAAAYIQDEYFVSDKNTYLEGLRYMLSAYIANKINGYNGHITLRVLPGGKYFYVYILDDSDFEYRVKSIHGPYKSK